MHPELEPDGTPTAFVRLGDTKPTWHRARTSTQALESLGIAEAFGAPVVDDQGDWYLFSVGDEAKVWRAYSASPITLGHAETGYFAQRGAASQAGKVVSLAIRGGAGAPDELWAASRQGSTFTASSLGISLTQSELRLAADGTRLLGGFVTESGAWQGEIRVAQAAAVKLPFVIGNTLEGPLGIAPGDSSWLAAAHPLASAIQVAFPGGEQLELPNSARLEDVGCAQNSPVCTPTCTQKTTGVRGIVALGHAGNAYFAYVDVKIDRTFDLEPRCGGPGCICDPTLKADATTADLVIVRVSTSGATEVARWPTEYLGVARLIGVQRGGRAALAYGRQIVGIDLGKL